MTVPTILQLYTTAYGWGLYNLLWTLFAGLGIAIYPVMMMVYNNWRGPSEHASSVAPSSLVSLQKMKWALGFKTVVLALAVIPAVDFNVTELKYVKSCGGNTLQTLEYGETGTTHDALNTDIESLNGSDSFQIPVIWAIVMKVTAGINHYMIRQLPCLGEIAQLDTQLRNVVLDDPVLKEEYAQFYRQCFIPAKNKFHAALRRSAGPRYDHVKTALEEGEYDVDALTEIDSEFFKETAGFYAVCTNPGECGKTFRAHQPVDGFVYKPARDTDFSPGQVNANIGQPYCGEWWDVLREDLATAAKIPQPLSRVFMDQGVTAAIEHVMLNYPFITADDEIKTKLAIRSLVRSNPTDMSGVYESEDTLSSQITLQKAELLSRFNLDSLTLGAAGVGSSLALMIPGVGDLASGVASQVGGFYVALYIAKIAAPMMQALILMMIYALLPLYLIISEYEVESVITAVVLIFVISFLSVVFAIAEYLENALFATMYPNIELLGSMMTMGVQRVVLDMMLMMLYIVVPGLLLYLVTLAGRNIVGAGSAGDGAVNKVGTAGGAVGAATGTAAVKAARSVTKR